MQNKKFDLNKYDISDYIKNPIVTFEHNYGIPPIGKAVVLKDGKWELRLTKKFLKECPRALELLHLDYGYIPITKVKTYSGSGFKGKLVDIALVTKPLND
jgi:hypothetical protein